MSQEEIDEIKSKVLPVLKEAGVKRSALFGSVVRGEDTDASDVDILVELPREYSLFGFVRLKRVLSEALGRDVDLVEYDAVKPALKEYVFQGNVEIL